MTAKSSAKLAKAIREHPEYNALDLNNPLLHLAARAEADYYNDYLSDLATPCVQLMTDLNTLGLHDLAERHSKGEFDAGSDEADQWANSPDGKATFAELGKIIEEALKGQAT